MRCARLAWARMSTTPDTPIRLHWLVAAIFGIYFPCEVGKAHPVLLFSENAFIFLHIF